LHRRFRLQDPEDRGGDVAHVRVLIAEMGRKLGGGGVTEPNEIADRKLPNPPRIVAQVGDPLLAGLRIDRAAAADLRERVSAYPLEHLRGRRSLMGWIEVRHSRVPQLPDRSSIPRWR